jgi:hypothetical protein
MDRLSEDQPNVTLDFVDPDHVLLTFNQKRLFRRHPECPPDHEDRLMHAAILEVPSGKVVNEADWYLHDRRRYLWPLTPGKFLLRRLNTLYIVDSSLHETLLMDSPKDLLWVSVTPDGSQIVIETPAATNADKSSTSQPAPTYQAQPKFVAQFLDAKTLVPQRTIPLNAVVNLTGTGAGYIDLVHKGDIWLLRFGPTPARRRNLARVRSRTVPSVLYSSNNSLLIGRCSKPDCDYSVTAFTLTGHRLWQQHWNRYRLFPSIARSADNSRFAVSTLRIAPSEAINTGSTPDDPEDAFQPERSQVDVFKQDLQIYDTATGSPVLSVTVTPAVMTGQNFSLSPDGRRVATIDGSGLELFDLPPFSAEEQTKLSALQSDLLEYALGPTPDATSGADDASPDSPAAATPVSAEASSDSPINVAEASPIVGAAPSPDSNNANALSPTTVAGQSSQAESAPMTTIRVSTKAVVVDVVVTDNKGHPVKGLSQQDFQVMEDGKGQDVRFFREFSDLEEAKAQASTDPAPPAPAMPAKPSPKRLHQPDSCARLRRHHPGSV